ncbi:MAG: imelysin family protein [Saprospiraceae bacterium]
MKFLKIFFILFISSVFLFTSCKDDDEKDPCSSDFDQVALFTNVADNIILPSYENLKTKVDELSTKTQNFVTTPDEIGLIELREAFKAAYLTWQSAAQFEFGPAEDVFLRNSLNNFPANTSQIEFNIENETNNFDQPDTYDQGFPALDFLLFGIAGSDDVLETVNVYANNVDKEKYKKHLSDLVTDMQVKVTQTNDKWISSYRNTFITRTGTAAGNSLSQIINGWNENYELIKRNKIGVPSGVLDLNFPLPDKVEAVYSGISSSLAVAALNASLELYLGMDREGNNGIGLDDFLEKVDAEKNGKTLDEVIQEQFTNAINAVTSLPDPLSDSIENDETPTVLAYNETTKQVVNIKTDLPSVLCISITYIDNPSDSD